VMGWGCGVDAHDGLAVSQLNTAVCPICQKSGGVFSEHGQLSGRFRKSIPSWVIGVTDTPSEYVIWILRVSYSRGVHTQDQARHHRLETMRERMRLRCCIATSKPNLHKDQTLGTWHGTHDRSNENGA
jgi:hypothetical protein